MKFMENSNIAVHSDDLLLLEESTIKEIFLPNILTAQTVNSIISALSSEGYLLSTNGHRKPTTVYDIHGTPMSKNFIAVKFSDIVNADTLNYIENMKSNCFFGEISKKQLFIPLIQNNLGKAAGQIVIPNENMHRCVTGKSGSGKTEFLKQLIPKLSGVGNCVVVFDDSGSFTEKELLWSLSCDFVHNNITFYNIDENGLPVNLFHTYPQDKPLKKIKMIQGILGEAVHNPSQNQEIALKNIVRRIFQNEKNP